MTWLKTDDKFPEHRKIRRLTDAAYRLHHTAMCACAKDETDGLVTEADIADMEHGPRLRKHLDALVDAHLWEAVDGGWIIHDFLDYNPSHGQQEDKRTKQRERQAQWRAKRTETPDDDVSQRDAAVGDASVTRRSHDPVPTRPDPSRPVPVVGVLHAVGDGSAIPNRHLGDVGPTATLGLAGEL